jgi:dihydrofolate reductase
VYGGPNVRTVVFGVANSLDNFIARKNAGVDWLLWGKEAAAFMAEFWKTIDTIVMGRKTYDVALKSGGTGHYGNMKTIVFSKTLKEVENESLIVTAKDPGKFLHKLKQQPGKSICVMGGGELARTLFEADVIDEIGFNIHPVLLGAGIPLFLPMKRQIDLELLECSEFKNGCVLVRYRIKHRPARGAKSRRSAATDSRSRR